MTQDVLPCRPQDDLAEDQAVEFQVHRAFPEAAFFAEKFDDMPIYF